MKNILNKHYATLLEPTRRDSTKRRDNSGYLINLPLNLHFLPIVDSVFKSGKTGQTCFPTIDENANGRRSWTKQTQRSTTIPVHEFTDSRIRFQRAPFSMK